MSATYLRRCPKCRSVNITWIETTRVYMAFDQTSEGISTEGWGGGNPGAIALTGAACRDCGAKWRPRGADMVISLPGYGDSHG